jgi:hypothetical protein
VPLAYEGSTIAIADRPRELGILTHRRHPSRSAPRIMLDDRRARSPCVPVFPCFWSSIVVTL